MQEQFKRLQSQKYVIYSESSVLILKSCVEKNETLIQQF